VTSYSLEKVAQQGKEKEGIKSSRRHHGLRKLVCFNRKNLSKSTGRGERACKEKKVNPMKTWGN
jgi:hypothetical protein